MGVYSIRLPDIGEGVAEAELTEWHVKPGDVVQEDDVLAAVMTDKAAIEVPSSVSGTVLELGGEIGDMIAVGGTLIKLEVEGEGNESATAAPPKPAEKDAAPEPKAEAAEKPAEKPAAKPAPKPARNPQPAPNPHRSNAPKAPARWPPHRCAPAPGKKASTCAMFPARAPRAGSAMRIWTVSSPRAGSSRAA